jgi:hypothetical protein
MVPVRGRTDTCFGVKVMVDSCARAWIVPMKKATMNQAALYGLIWGIKAILPPFRRDLLVLTDILYLQRACARKGTVWQMRVGSNVDLIKQVRDLLGSVDGAEVQLRGDHADVVALNQKVRDKATHMLFGDGPAAVP